MRPYRIPASAGMTEDGAPGYDSSSDGDLGLSGPATRWRASILRRAASAKLYFEAIVLGSLDSSVAASSGTPGPCPASILCRAICSKVIGGLGGSADFGGQLTWTSPVGLGGSADFGGQLTAVWSPGFVGVGPCPPEGLRGSFFAVTPETIPGL